MSARRKKKKTSKRKYQIKKRSSSGDLLAVQIAVRLKRVPKGFKFTREIIEKLIRKKAALSVGEWITTGPGEGYASGCKAGPNPPGIELTIIRWENPDRYSAALRAYRYPVDSLPVGVGQDEAWGTLRRPIAAGRIAIQFLRKNGGV